MAITQAQVDLLNRYAVGAISGKVPLGTLIKEAGEVVTADLAAGSVTAAKLAADAVETAKILDLNVTTGKLAADAVTNAKIADTAVSLEHLDSGIAPSHVVKFAGKFTTLGGDATEVISISGLAATDVVVVTVQTAGGTPRTVVSQIPTTNTLTVVLSGDPSTDHILSYVAWRAAS